MPIAPLALPTETIGSTLTATEWNTLVAKVGEIIAAVNALAPEEAQPETVTITAVTPS